MRRECLDFLIPLSERHLRRLLRDWVHRYNSGRPRANLGPGYSRRGTKSRNTVQRVQPQIQEDLGTDGSPNSWWITPRVCLAETGRLRNSA